MSNKKTMDPLINTLVGIDNVATRELEDPSGSEPTAELTIIMHAARAALELVDELQLASEDEAEDEEAPATPVARDTVSVLRRPQK